MSWQIWRIATDTPDYTADDPMGEGARRTGGRWNRKGLSVLYCAESIALATLETFVHLDSGSLPLNRYLVRIDVPEVLWDQAAVLQASTLTVGWDAEPPGKVSLDIGDAWLNSPGAPLLLRVPSVIVPLEFNVLVNPRHPAASELTFTKERKWTYDTRMARLRKK
nr:RES family NAD+ phosphorylase [uncultured Noviherbaspirillum sp.]